MKLIPTTRLGVAVAAASGIAILAGGGMGGYALAASTTAPPSNLYACVRTSDRAVVGAYTVAANFKGCPSNEFAVTVASTPGQTGPAGPAGPAGATGPQGPSGLEGAYYSVAKYDAGDTNGGAIATVACKDTTDVAVSGGVQTLALGSNGIRDNVPVSSSFPGRMDWSTNTPIQGRLDGWVVQFGGNSGSTSLGDPKYVDIYALCVPGADIPVDSTYTESGS